MNKIALRIDFQNELSKLFELNGQVAFVPGGYGGIGEAITWGLALSGAKVIIAGRDLTKAEKLASEFSAAGHHAKGITIDVTSVVDIERAVQDVVQTYGQIDILMNCVGTQKEQVLLEVTEEAFDEVYQVKLRSAMFLALAVAKRQVAVSIGGKHVHLLSVRSHFALRDRGYSAFCATKGGKLMLIKQHLMELAPQDITANGVAPTFVYTEMIRHVMENDEFRQVLLDRIPLGRITDPKDVDGPALFFCAPASGFVTGQTLYVDGGITSSQ